MATIKIDLLQDLRKAARAKPPLEDVAATLRDFKNLGGTQAEALEILQQIRTEFQDDASEDYILEMMDIATGFCAPRFRVWPDTSPS